MNRWYALHTKRCEERPVAALLRARGVDVYLPTMRVNPICQRTARASVLFPRYLFINVDLQEVDLSAFQWTPGLRGLVRLGEEPVVVPDVLINELKRHSQDSQVANKTAGSLSIEKSEQGVQPRLIKESVSDGYEMLFSAHLSGCERVIVLFTLLEQMHYGDGRAIRLNVGACETAHADVNPGQSRKNPVGQSEPRETLKKRRRRGRRRH